MKLHCFTEPAHHGTHVSGTEIGVMMVRHHKRSRTGILQQLLIAKSTEKTELQHFRFYTYICLIRIDRLTTA